MQNTVWFEWWGGFGPLFHRATKNLLTNICYIANISNMTNIARDFATTLRAIRTELNLTQEQLAERLGVSFATVNRWEGGNSKPQRAAQEAIAALALEAGVSEASAAGQVQAPAFATPRRGRRAAAAPTTKPMEQMLWDAACSIRGEKDAAKFKDYLLPLLFLKRLSDVFDDEIARLAEDYGDRATALEITEADHSLLRFYLPPEARWAILSGREVYDWPVDEKGRCTAPRDIGEHLTRAVRAVVKHNPDLSGVLDVVDFAAERNGERDINPAKLRGVVETFSDPRYRLGLADVQPDFLGRAYEYLLRKFAEGSGQSAGEFFTPTEVGFLMAHILRPRPGETCHDYACGSAGLLIKMQLVARELDPTSRVPVKLSGQELQAESYAVARMNAIIHDMEVELARGDTMINPKFRDAAGRIRGHDILVANPMWNQPFAPDLFKNDPFERFQTTGGITSGKGDWAWLQHTLSAMDDDGRACVVLDTGAVTRGSGSKNEDKERNIRKWFVDHDLIDGVILLPENLFYNTTAAGVIVVLNKRKPAARKGKIHLLNASRHSRKGKPKNYLPDEDIRPLAAMYLKGEPIEGELAIITTQQAEEADYNLSPSRWVGQNGNAEIGSIPNLLLALEQLNEQEASLTSNLLQLLRPLAKTEGA
ncbi:TPA: N-6 DNA methylase [Pseudomonas aeruginosa]|uniref:N-6 DNA methylase n=1 Tax=Pseudomonas aeruginosa TaxID=287 RepID=UPI002B26ED87|nr:N-6 DNA methylase [Pseudomonas aeruginosa]MCS8174869.1 N-6 DNA methylase [Pseudomonas aeruginosa]MEA8511744.1 N-6 DNA methylase [Pseudomonas aeruginosa]MEA8585688.1 N-6 DNA methylase [Pseudomonas aeruginosa]HCE6421727.1 N-6 DNA methylase [Pseudomonas aeruginosa]HCE6508670.1 N-6 DNA methylase [Pseudomonas aeruginosa]